MEIDTNSIKEEIFRSTPKQILAESISKNYPGVRVTNKLIESYIMLALSREFTLDKTIYEIRKMNPYDSEIENRLVFILEDDSKVAISEEMFNKISKVINNNVVDFMRKNKENFIGVVDILGEENG